MSEQKFIAIGDIHGCMDSMLALLKKLEPWMDRTVVFIGDYIDRGPASRDVVEYLIEFSRDHHCVMLRGNHEQMMLDALRTNDAALWIYNGGDTTLMSYDHSYGSLKIPPDHLEFYNNTRLYYDTPDYFFVHAGLPPRLTISKCLEDNELEERFLWERSHLKSKKNKWEKTVVFGHTPKAEPIISENMIGIDTGCVYKHHKDLGKLTAVLLPEKKFIQQKCLDELLV